jgi:hypothetical protein
MTFWREAAAIAVGIAAYDIAKGVVGWLLDAAGLLRRPRFRKGWWD